MAWKLPILLIVILTIGISCYVGPDINCWDYQTIEDASKKVGMDLFIIPSVEWTNYSGIQDMEDNNFRIYECIWRKGSKEWIVYKRESGSYYFFRFFDSEFNRWDFQTIEDASQKVGVNLSAIVSSQWVDCDFILNLTNGCNYRVYECLWRKKAEEWTILKKDGEKYSWHSFPQPVASP